jgi:hypothetical protein
LVVPDSLCCPSKDFRERKANFCLQNMCLLIFLHGLMSDDKNKLKDYFIEKIKCFMFGGLYFHSIL